MDRKSIARFKKSLQARHRELQSGVARTQQNLHTAQHDYGKDEGDRANTSLTKASRARSRDFYCQVYFSR
jgi:hypothetical protein